MNWNEIIQEHLIKLGFTQVGFVRLPKSNKLDTRLNEWLNNSHHGEMAWMAREPARRSDPQQVLENAQTLISCTFNYFTEHKRTNNQGTGWISRYAWGDDYHDLMLSRLKETLKQICELIPASKGLAYVDTGPVLEKSWGENARIGWQGKHTNLIDPQRGSWFFIGEIITTAPLPENWAPPQESKASCGKCTKCIEVCPTNAILTPYKLDARLCISYLTIEHKGVIPRELRPLIGSHIYGCDLCQDVCPWNRFATPTVEPTFQPRNGLLNPQLSELMYMTNEQFSARFKHSPIKRIKRRRLLRNVAIALGNIGASADAECIAALLHGITDSEPLIRAHSVWALRQIGGENSLKALRRLKEIETEKIVLDELI